MESQVFRPATSPCEGSSITVRMHDDMSRSQASERAIPEYAVVMVCRLPPAGAPIVPGSTPVVAFGDPARATVATLGINPSKNEFMEDGRLLTGTERRLATLDSLGAERLDLLTDAQVAT